MSKYAHILTPRQLVKEAGCKCRKPDVSNKKDVGPRCDRCGVQVVMVKRGVGY